MKCGCGVCPEGWFHSLREPSPLYDLYVLSHGFVQATHTGVALVARFGNNSSRYCLGQNENSASRVRRRGPEPHLDWNRQWTGMNGQRAVAARGGTPGAVSASNPPVSAGMEGLPKTSVLSVDRRLDDAREVYW